MTLTPEVASVLGTIAVGAVISVTAAVVNQLIRGKRARGEPVSALLLAIAAGLNVVALNPDKTVEQAKALAKPEEPKPPEVMP